MIQELAETNFYESWLTKWIVDFKPFFIKVGLRPSLSILFNIYLNQCLYFNLDALIF